MELPFVYRTHDNPDPEKINQLGIFISNFGYGMKTAKEEVHPKEITETFRESRRNAGGSPY